MTPETYTKALHAALATRYVVEESDMERVEAIRRVSDHLFRAVWSYAITIEQAERIVAIVSSQDNQAARARSDAAIVADARECGGRIFGLQVTAKTARLFNRGLLCAVAAAGQQGRAR